MPEHAFLQGDARKLPLADQSVHAVITSPPYYQLRAYTDNDREIGHGGINRYVNDLSAVFSECRRALRDDGVLVLNMGDTYADKQLLGIPWAVAWRLRADGWLLRSDSIWFKPNAMPDTAQDRPEAMHEYCFVFAKSRRNYWDKFAVERPDRLSVRRVPVGRSKHKHFASYPPKLVIPYIRQATSEAGYCVECGDPWVRHVIKERVPTRPGRDNKFDASGMAKRDSQRHCTKVETLGWKPSCSCGPIGVVSTLELQTLRFPEMLVVPGVVLDPFAGACTTAVACEWTGRNSVMVDLSGEYLAVGQDRVQNERPPRPKAKVQGWDPLPGQMIFPNFLNPV